MPKLGDPRSGAVALALAACAALRLAGVEDPGPIELLPVLGAAMWFPRVAAMVTAGLASVPLLIAALADMGFDPSTVVVRIGLLLVVAHLVCELVERLREREDELKRARPFQDVLAPREPRQLPLLEIASRYIPTEAGVAGDFYLAVEGPNNATVFVIADVAGKGPEAARRAVFVRAILGALATYSNDPASILRTANAELIRQYGPSSSFITALCLVVRADLTVVWSSAGHPPPVSIADGRAFPRRGAGHPLGIAPEIPDLQVAEFMLPPEGILLYTDGLTEARPPGSKFEPFGEHRIRLFLEPLEDPTPEQTVAELADAAHVFARGRLPDDLCLVAIRSRFDRDWTRPERAEQVERVSIV